MAEDNTTKSKLVEIEESIFAFWNKNNIFKKTLERKPLRGDFVFYDGPPFATGLPHFGHLLPTTIKDVIPRYKTMCGYRVRRRWGWDCHGLPIENLIEKELGLAHKKDIESFGIEKFNKAAEQSVLRYADEWRRIIPRVGRWVDMEDDYRTMDCGYTESVWWAFKTLYDKKLVREGFKSMQLCPRCETTLSNFEVNQGYKDITDISVYVKFQLRSERDTFLLAWTTTPWTLPGNVALAVGNDISYVKIKLEESKKGEHGEDIVSDVFYILAEERVKDVLGEKPHVVIEKLTGKNLVGLSYNPVFPYYNTDSLENHAQGFKVYPADFVTTTDGTGIVHIAPAFGEDDMNLGRLHKLPFIQHVGTDGLFKKEVHDFAHLPVKPKDDHQKADIEIIKYLAHKGFLFDKKKIIHSYPHCWRCSTPLLNYASSSWFVTVSDFKDKLVAENKKVQWSPGDIRDGRFGKWLLGARDWAISRSRFWGAPLPVWKSEEGEQIVIGSLEEIKKYSRSRNTYYGMRHGEADNNVLRVLSSLAHTPHHLTEKGKDQVRKAAASLKEKNIDMIFVSPLVRTQETAEIVRDFLGLSKKQIVVDDRLREVQVGDFEGEKHSIIQSYYSHTDDRFTKRFPQGENYSDIEKRMGVCLSDIDKKYEGKNILIITHDSPLWLLIAQAQGLSRKQTVDLRGEGEYFIPNAEVRPVSYSPLPRDGDFSINYHRPYIDDIVLTKNGKTFKRVPEVFDCWFESGSMPFAEAHYPFDKSEFDPNAGLFKKSKGYPADFIAEGLDQTRGWFYSMLVLGVALFDKSPYKNVVVNGLVLAEDGQKMAKSKNNYPPLMPTIEKYGADSLRYFFASSPAVKAEDVCFSEKGVDEVAKKLLQRLDNVLSFYELYVKKDSPVSITSQHVLDLWIRARFNETVGEVTKRLEAYELDKAARPLMDFVDDLSNWYLRRSRDRFKGDNEQDKNCALSTIHAVLLGLSKIMAPFTPFYADYLYRRLHSVPFESVHLDMWPKTEALSKDDGLLIQNMAQVRTMVTLGLEARMKVKVNVRQPLSRLTVGVDALTPELGALIQDEVNVKQVIVDSSLKGTVILDAVITPELREEGNMREFIRFVQDMRKKDGFIVGDMRTLVLDTQSEGTAFVEKWKNEIMRANQLKHISYESPTDGSPLSIGTLSFKVKII